MARVEVVTTGYVVWGRPKDASDKVREKKLSRVFHAKQAAEAFRDQAVKCGLYRTVTVRDEIGTDEVT